MHADTHVQTAESPFLRIQSRAKAACSSCQLENDHPAGAVKADTPWCWTERAGASSCQQSTQSLINCINCLLESQQMLVACSMSAKRVTLAVRLRHFCGGAPRRTRRPWINKTPAAPRPAAGREPCCGQSWRCQAGGRLGRTARTARMPLSRKNVRSSKGGRTS